MKQTYTALDTALLEEAQALLVTIASAMAHFIERASVLAEKIRRKEERNT